MMRLILIWAIVGIFTVGCGGGDDGGNSGAEDFAKEMMEAQIRHQWGVTYEQLHPEQRDDIDRDLYITCREDVALPAFDVFVDDSYRETIPTAGVSAQESTAVTLKLSNDLRSEFLTLHVYNVDGDYYWVLNEDTYTAYAEGRCS